METALPPDREFVRVRPVPRRFVLGWGYLRRLDDEWQVQRSIQDGSTLRLHHFGTGLSLTCHPAQSDGMTCSTVSSICMSGGRSGRTDASAANLSDPADALC